MVEHEVVAERQRAAAPALSHAPIDVARRWASAVADGDLDTALSLYGPGATLHAGADVILGPANIRDYWSSSPATNAVPAEVSLDERGFIVMTWQPTPQSASSDRSRLHIRRGKIVEQWVGDVLASHGHLAAVPIEISVSGPVSDGARDAAVEMVDRALNVIDEPVLHVRLRLEHATDRSRLEPITLRATIDLRGDAVRAHVTASGTHAAIEALEAKLRARLRSRTERRRDLHRRSGAGGEGHWHHGDEPTPRTPYFPRPAEERQVVRYKTVSPGASTVEEAMFDLESMDYDFFLFIDADTGRDAFVAKPADDAPTAARVRYLVGPPAEGGSGRVPAGVVVDERPAPTMGLVEAQERLDVGIEPWLFFCDTESGRGHVLYRRYDGHYGLIVPADEDM